MRFPKKETAQDVVVTCCILHNMRKATKQLRQVYTQNEYQHQNLITRNLLEAEQNMRAQRFRIQNFLVDNYFN